MEPFADNLDHIKSLEREASLILAVTYLRRNKHGLKEDEDYFFPSFPLIKPDATIDDVQVVLNLVTPNGIMLAADSFHGGWKQQCPQSELRALFETKRLKTFEAGEGIGGLKSDQ